MSSFRLGQEVCNKSQLQQQQQLNCLMPRLALAWIIVLQPSCSLPVCMYLCVCVFVIL